MGLLNTVKMAAAGVNEAQVPTAFMFGTVTAAEPLAIRVENRFDISGDAIVVMRNSVYEADDKVVLLRNQGGQSFLVLGRM